MKDVTGFEGDITFDTTKPDGTPRKIMDNTRLFDMGWRPTQTIESGLRKMYAYFCDHVAGQ